MAVAATDSALRALFDPPEDWVWTNLDKRTVETQGGFAHARKHAVQTGLPHLRPFNIGTDGQLDLRETINIPVDLKDNLAKYALRQGDVLFNNTNSVELVGKTALVRKPLRCAFSNHVTRLRVRDNDQLDPAWLTLCLRVLWIRGYFERNSKRWIGQAGFSTKDLATLAIPLPGVEIQRRIVGRLETLLDEVQRAQTVVEAMRRDLARVQQAILEQALQGEL